MRWILGTLLTSLVVMTVRLPGIHVGEPGQWSTMLPLLSSIFVSTIIAIFVRSMLKIALISILLGIVFGFAPLTHALWGVIG